MISVQHNMLAENANRQFNVNIKKNAKLAEKLSSGYKINRAADDAAGLAISEKMRRQVRGIGQAADNIKDGIGYVQTAEGALNEAQDILQRINQLSVQAANGTNTVSDRAYINSEVQQLKAELSRIFSTTTFNEQRIWEPGEVTLIDGYVPKQAVRFTGSSKRFDITNENCDVIADRSGYKIKADEKGVSVSWTGYNGTTYETNTIGWKKLKDQNYTFELSSLFKPEDTDLKSSLTGEALIQYRISLDVHDMASVDDIINSIDGRVMETSTYLPISTEFEDGKGNTIPKNWTGTPTNIEVSFSGSLDMEAAYQSHKSSDTSNEVYNFDVANDPFLKPVLNGNSNLSSPNNDNEKWSFSFYMEGVGTVTAVSNTTTVSAPDRDEDACGIWWDWYNPPGGGERQKVAISRTFGNGSLGNVVEALTGERGVLSKKEGGKTNNGGSLSLSFKLMAGNTSIGSLSTSIPIFGDDTKQKVLDRISDTLDSNTVLDILTTESNVKYPSGTISPASVKHPQYVQIPVYGQTVLQGKENFWVQAGAEAGQHIDIEYESLSLEALGMKNTDTLTAESAGRAINEVKGALQVVSDQRSLFGAYQNRLEHACNINKNVEENTQAAESLIRDTDIADAMMEYSINNILLQAGTSMLTQANQSSRLIMQLLG